MSVKLLGMLVLSLTTCLIIGCADKPATAPALPPSAPTASAASTIDEAKIAKSMSQLPDADRIEAIAQKFCVIEHNNRLGLMGQPHKVLVSGQPVFLCCAGCEEEAIKHPQETLAKVEQLKQAAKSESAR